LPTAAKDAEVTTPQEAPTGASTRSPIWRWLRSGALILVLFAIVDYLVLPQLAGTRHALKLLDQIRPGWVVVGVVVEVLSLISYSLLTRTVLSPPKPTYPWLLRTDVTALGVSHVLPGGTATASALRYRLLRLGGARPEDAAIGMALQAVGSTLVLVALTSLALLVSIPVVGFNVPYLIAAIVGVIVVAASALAVVALSRQPVPATGVARRVIGVVPHRFQPAVERALRGAADQVRRLVADRRTLRSLVVFAAGNWLMDAASLWVFLAAYGHLVDPDGLLLAYGLANLLAILPITPGGLGVIEGVLIPSLVGFGTPRGVAVLGVISWRLFDFWAPIPAAGPCYLSLKIQEGRAGRGDAG
jgi:uncharacterized protein (TIRG00374 family)